MAQLVQLPSGHIVELSLHSPQQHQGTNERTQLAVLLHPWSWLGGNMNDPVLRILEEPLLERGYHVLRCNNRGVGRSKGWPSFTGAQEAQDFKEIVQWALNTVPNVRHLLLIGYSHGSLITSQHPPLSSNDSNGLIRTSHILLSYPLGPRAWLTLFHSKFHDATLNELVRNPASRVLIVYGDRDEFTGSDSYEQWAKQLKEQRRENTGETNSSRVTVSCIEGGSHFWAQGMTEEMLAAIEQWLDDT